MAINRNYQPAAKVISDAAYQTGLGQLKQFLQGQQQQRDMQSAQIDAQSRQQILGNAQQQQQQAASIQDAQRRQLIGLGSDQQMQANSIADAQLRQRVGIENDQTLQANSIADAQLRQRVGIENDQFQQGRALQQQAGLAAQELNARQASQAFAAQQQQAQTILGGQVQGSLAAQDALLKSGLYQQTFENQQALAQQEQLARSGLANAGFAHQTQLARLNSDLEVQQRTLTGAYSPTFDALTSRQLEQQQQQLQTKSAALARAAQQGNYPADALRQAQSELALQQQGLSLSMLGKNPAADRQAEFNSSLVYWQSTDALGQPVKIPLQKMKDGSYAPLEDPTARHTAAQTTAMVEQQAKVQLELMKQRAQFISNYLTTNSEMPTNEQVNAAMNMIKPVAKKP